MGAGCADCGSGDAGCADCGNMTTVFAGCGDCGSGDAGCADCGNKITALFGCCSGNAGCADCGSADAGCADCGNMTSVFAGCADCGSGDAGCADCGNMTSVFAGCGHCGSGDAGCAGCGSGDAGSGISNISTSIGGCSDISIGGCSDITPITSSGTTSRCGGCECGGNTISGDTGPGCDTTGNANSTGSPESQTKGTTGKHITSITVVVSKNKDGTVKTSTSKKEIKSPMIAIDKIIKK